MFAAKKELINSLVNLILKDERYRKEQREEHYWRLIEEAEKTGRKRGLILIR